MICEARSRLESVASCTETIGYEKSIGYEKTAVVGRDPAHRRTDPGADPQVVGRGQLRVRPRSDLAGYSPGPARGQSQRTLYWDCTLAWRRFHRDRGLGTPAVRSGTLAYGVSYPPRVKLSRNRGKQRRLP